MRGCFSDMIPSSSPVFAACDDLNSKPSKAACFGPLLMGLVEENSHFVAVGPKTDLEYGVEVNG